MPETTPTWTWIGQSPLTRILYGRQRQGLSLVHAPYPANRRSEAG